MFENVTLRFWPTSKITKCRSILKIKISDFLSILGAWYIKQKLLKIKFWYSKSVKAIQTSKNSSNFNFFSLTWITNTSFAPKGFEFTLIWGQKWIFQTILHMKMFEFVLVVYFCSPNNCPLCVAWKIRWWGPFGLKNGAFLVRRNINFHYRPSNKIVL